MNEQKCCICQKDLPAADASYHRKCARHLFGSSRVPVIAYTRDELLQLAKRAVAQQVTIPGVQEKLSLIQRVTQGESRLTLVGLAGEYILKAPTDRYPHLPENEAATMVLARLCGIDAAPSGLIRLSDNTLVYLTRRFDRRKGEEYHMEDMCQLTGRLTEDKYKGSVEQIGKVLLAHSSRPGFDLVSLFELVLFSFLTGNGDMHLKNYCMLHEPERALSPAFDLLNTRLLIPESVDNEDSALSINGKRKKLGTEDFYALGKRLTLTRKQVENVFSAYQKNLPLMYNCVGRSFLPDEKRRQYRWIIKDRAARLGIEKG